jgi:isopenicillin-N N-acyltransferase like protein
VTGLPVVRVRGGPRERGRAVGRALADPIGRSLAFYQRFLERRNTRPQDLPRLLGPVRAAAEGALPTLVAEVDAMAEGAGVDPWELFAVNAFEELEPVLEAAPAGRSDRCTAFAATSPAGTILAHNELWYAGDVGNVGVVVAQPDDGPGFASPTVVACLPAVGINGSGMAQAIMSLSAEDDRVGIPRVLVSRCALRATGPQDLIRRAAMQGRAGGYAHLVAAAGGQTFTVETSATRHAMLEGAVHTNHYLDPGLAVTGHSSAGSLGRLQRLEALLEERPPTTPQDAMAVLADHGGDPQPICVHPQDGDEEASATVFAMVCHLEERRMWVAAGNPCTHPFEEIDLPEVA